MLFKIKFFLCLLTSSILFLTCDSVINFMYPVIVSYSIDSKVEQYNHLVLHCEAAIDAKYEIAYQWYKKDINKNELVLLENETNNELVVNTDRLDDSYYYCAVFNVSDKRIVTNSGLIKLAVVINEQLLPKISYQSSDFYIEQYESLMIYCITDSEADEYHYQWYFKETPDADGELLDGEESCSIIIDTEKVHSGYYYCIISNKQYIGYDTISELIYIKVYEKEIESPNIVKCSDNTSIMPYEPVNLFVDCCIDGVGELTYQWFSRIPGNDFEKLEDQVHRELSLPYVEVDKDYYCEITNTYRDIKKISQTSVISIHVFTTDEIIQMKSELIRNNISEKSFMYDDVLQNLYLFIEDCKLEVNPDDVYIIGNKFLIPINITVNDKLSFLMELQEEIDNEAGVLLSFDDYYSVWNEVISYFDDNNITATWFINGNGTDELAANIAKSKQCLGYHGKDHMMLKKYDINTMGSNYIDKFDWEVFHFLPNYKKLGASMCAYAIPHGTGLWYDWQISRLLSYYKVVRDYEPYEKYYTIDEIRNVTLISSQSIDNRYFESDNDFKQKIKRRFVISKLGNLIYPCTSHTFSDNENENGGFVMTYNRLKILFGLIEKYKMKTYTYDDLFD